MVRDMDGGKDAGFDFLSLFIVQVFPLCLTF